MSTQRFTQGEWIAQSAKDFSPGRRDDDRWTVNLGGMPLIAVIEQNRGQAEFNAKLIAAAPKMHAALEAFVLACESSPPIDLIHEIGRCCELAKSALSKAET